MRKNLAWLFVLGLAATARAGEARISGLYTWGDDLFCVNRGNGHPGDKRAVASGDIFTGLSGRGWNGTGWTTSSAVSLELQASEAWTSTANGTKIVFKTTPVTTATSAASLTVSSSGLNLLTNAAPRTNLTPLAAGALVWNSADNQLCVSTGTATNSWVQVADGTTACSH